MRNYRDAKIMAKALRQELAEKGVSLTHSECLELVARQLGVDNWNILAARLAEEPAPPAKTGLTLPAGWIVGGSKPGLYDVGVDPQVRRGSAPVAVIRTRYPEDDPRYAETGFATLMQSVVADPFRGRRMRLTADLRTRDVVGAATLWLRVDGTPRGTLAFDNMEQRTVDGPLDGTRDWTPRKVVLDVPEEAGSLHFGFYLRGLGCAWATGFDLHEAPSEEVTGGTNYRQRPTNLDFREPG
ncbi:glyoxalase superfamily protein [Phenylobacterium sp.]|uniref:glyoxalase superfamily protein n=1 Tax=Phenylobacterium sp. TaxID=1871053 RepID=UPI002C38481D|nr:glyoxalase superfamily protein [Phenylobacterium sp.]HLZ75324.1 glyoxalase superfamily protein [Phenylobacterium sp.]